MASGAYTHTRALKVISRNQARWPQADAPGLIKHQGRQYLSTQLHSKSQYTCKSFKIVTWPLLYISVLE